jgi:hypothetical protein
VSLFLLRWECVHFGAVCQSRLPQASGGDLATHSVQQEFPHYNDDNNHHADCDSYDPSLICLFLLKHAPSMPQTRCESEPVEIEVVPQFLRAVCR